MSTEKNVDVLAVLATHAEMREAGDKPNLASELLQCRDAVADFLDEAKKIEVSIHQLGMTCEAFTAAIARVGGAP